VTITPELYEFIVKVVEDKVREIRVTREEFEKLREHIDRLTKVQVRTEERLEQLTEAVNRLAEAQRRTEERLEMLVEAQLRTEERLEALAKRVDQLAEAQAMTEKRLKQLAEAQHKTEEQLERLAKRMDQLAEAVDKLRVEVGRLSETVGFGLEDVARVVLPGWLHRHLGVEVEELRREFFVVEGEEIEVNLYGEGLVGKEEVVVIGEVRSRIYGSDVERFYWKVYRPVSKLAKTRAIGVLFGYLVHPSAKKRAEELGLHVVASYER